MTSSRDDEPLRCSTCGSPLMENLTQCPGCGTDLNQETAAMFFPRAGAGTRLLAWIVLTAIGLIAFLALYLIVRAFL